MTQPTYEPPELKAQEIPFDHPESNCHFVPDLRRPFVATPAAIAAYGEDEIEACLLRLQNFAVETNGLDELQVFVDPTKPEPLWIMENGPGGAITALLPSEY